MKSKISLIFSLIVFFSYSQIPINNFNSAPLSNYAVVTSTTAISQNTTGTNLTWSFNTLVTTGSTTVDSYTVPTTNESTTYPGTTSVVLVTESPSGNINSIFSKKISNTVSITGATGVSFDLNYITDNALIGTFPLSYGYANTDAVAGTFTSTSGSGTFTGTINVSVDAYGTLIMNDVGNGIFNGNVTRLKIIQNLNLSISTLFGSIPGTVTQTSYNYYADNGDIMFRTTDTNLSVPSANINQNTSLIESLLNSSLSINEVPKFNSSLKIAPNPVNSELNILLENSEVIRSIQILDLNGRKILSKTKSVHFLPVSHLQSGLYFITITTKEGAFSQKFIKK